MKAPLYDQKGIQQGEITLLDYLFNGKVSKPLIHAALVRQLAHARQGTAKIKTRSGVRGGGRKPYRQKGTGRARQGTIRAPHYRGGGVVFGPTGEENYKQRMTRKMRRGAFIASLTIKAQEGRVAVLESFILPKPKTKEMVSFLEKLSFVRNVVIVQGKSDAVLEKSVANIPYAKTLPATSLNIKDVLQAHTLIFLQSGLQKTEEIFKPL